MRAAGRLRPLAALATRAPATLWGFAKAEREGGEVKMWYLAFSLVNREISRCKRWYNRMLGDGGVER